jgi:hypothetical protein
MDVWDQAREFLPDELDALALETGALVRRRVFKTGEQLLRACLLYADSNSFRTSSALVRGSGLANVSSEALFYRLGVCEQFLEKVLGHLVNLAVRGPVASRVLLVDATSISGHGSKGTDFRVHVAYEPVRAVPCSVLVEDASIGEQLSLHGLQPGSLAVADRGYGTPRNIDSALTSGVDVLVRVHRGQMRFLNGSDNKVDWSLLESQVPETGTVGFSMTMPVPPPEARNNWNLAKAMRTHEVRLIGARSKRGEVIWLLTNLPDTSLSAQTACELYRIRWQVELYFKRLKSLGGVGDQLSRDGPTSRSSLLAKMIIMVLASLIQDKEQAFSPYGYPIRERAQPLERVRLHPEAPTGVVAA